MFIARLIFRLFFARKVNRMTPSEQAEFFADDFRYKLIPKRMALMRFPDGQK